MISTGLIKYSMQSLRKRWLRSMLTIISVMIGIAAITSLISFGNGISSYVGEVAKKMGNDKLMVQPRGFGFGPTLNANVKLDDDDLKVIEGVNGVEEATGIYLINAEIEFDKQKKYTYLFGSDFKDHQKLIKELYTLELVEGNELKGKEKDRALFGYNYRVPDKIFKKPLRLRDNVLLNGKEIQVAGFYEEVGNPQDDAQVYVTNEAAEEVFGAKSYQFLIVRASPSSVPTELTKQISEALRKHRNQKKGNEDFFVQTFEQVIATFTSVLSAITAVVVIIGLISVVVAAVNIMNTMYTAVLERTKDIGIMKAIGARNSDILNIFLVESGMIGFVGGVFGVLVGSIMALIIGQFSKGAGFLLIVKIEPLVLIFGLSFAFIVGIISGILPAYQASKLKPVDALRYE